MRWYGVAAQWASTWTGEMERSMRCESARRRVSPAHTPNPTQTQPVLSPTSSNHLLLARTLRHLRLQWLPWPSPPRSPSAPLPPAPSRTGGVEQDRAWVSELNGRIRCQSYLRKNTIVASENGNPPLMPAIMTAGGPLDLATVLFGNRIIFIGQYINSQVAQRVISQLVTLSAVDEEADILIYLNCPGGSLYSILAIYDCMSWIKPKVGTVCFGVVASQAAILLAGGEKGMRYAMPNARVMIHQPQGGSEGNVEEVRRQVGETIYARDKVDKMFAAFTGQPLDIVQQWTERDRFMSSSEAMDFGLVDALLETRY